MPVHLGGRPVDMDRVNAIRDRHGLAVVEDAAHAIGAAWDGTPIGAHGNSVSFSFHATKNMTTIEGGALVLWRDDDAERTGRLALQGLSRSSWNRHGSAGPADYDVVEPGFKLSMTDVEAAVGIHQLPQLDEWLTRREGLARRYDELLAGLPLEVEPPVPPGARHARHVYSVLVDHGAPMSRNELIEHLHRANIGSSVHFKALHFLTYYRDRYGLPEEAYPVASDYSQRTLSLPLHPRMTEVDQDEVVKALTEALS
jgi:dTDP-4-amino-4,6-dideoxygalactose transaminase